jgi:hypothetical protein
VGAGSPKAELGTFEMDGRHKSDTTLLFGAACIHPGKRFNYPLLGKTMGKGMKTTKDEDNKVIQFLILQLSLADKWKKLT